MVAQKISTLLSSHGMSIEPVALEVPLSGGEGGGAEICVTIPTSGGEALVILVIATYVMRIMHVGSIKVTWRLLDELKLSSGKRNTQ